MFTGLVETTGTVDAIETTEALLRLTISPKHQEDFEAKLGDSIAVNGCCLTVAIPPDSRALVFEVSHETLKKTNLAALKVGQLVNLERAMQLGDRLGGHLVLGHVDGLAKIHALDKRSDGWDVGVTIPKLLARYLIDKGSICLDGVSLTINELLDYPEHSEVRLTLIPTTLAETTLQNLELDQSVNLEVDVLGKYMERLNKFN